MVVTCKAAYPDDHLLRGVSGRVEDINFDDYVNTYRLQTQCQVVTDILEIPNYSTFLRKIWMWSRTLFTFTCIHSFLLFEVYGTAIPQNSFKGEVHPKIITSYLVVFGALSRMVKVWGACGKPFWIYKRLNNCAAPTPDSDNVSVVASLACPAHKNTASSTTKTSSLFGGGGGGGTAQLFNRLFIQNGFSHAPQTFTIRLSAPNTTKYEVIIFEWTSCISKIACLFCVLLLRGSSKIP